MPAISPKEASCRSSFRAAVQGLCDAVVNTPLRAETVIGFEARLNGLVAQAFRCGELLNKTPPRAFCRVLLNTRPELSVVWSETPIVKEVNGP